MKKLLNPFEKYQENQLFIVGIVSLLLTSCLAFVFKFSFDGLIDLHSSKNIIWFQPFIDQLVNVTLLSLTLFIFGKKINIKTRFIDVLNAVLIARIPFVILLFSNINNTSDRVTDQLLKNIQNPDLIILDTFSLTFLLFFSIISILVLIWFFILLWNGFKVATYAKSNQTILGFILVFITTYIISKSIVYLY
jgi:hypothetical protein